MQKIITVFLSITLVATDICAQKQVYPYSFEKETAWYECVMSSPQPTEFNPYQGGNIMFHISKNTEKDMYLLTLCLSTLNKSVPIISWAKKSEDDHKPADFTIRISNGQYIKLRGTIQNNTRHDLRDSESMGSVIIVIGGKSDAFIKQFTQNDIQSITYDGLTLDFGILKTSPTISSMVEKIHSEINKTSSSTIAWAEALKSSLSESESSAVPYEKNLSKNSLTSKEKASSPTVHYRDAIIYELKGNVQQCTYYSKSDFSDSDKYTQGITVWFSSNGKVYNINNDDIEYSRDKNNEIILEKEKSSYLGKDCILYREYKYNNGKVNSKRSWFVIVGESQRRAESEDFYYYNADGNIYKVISKDLSGNGRVDLITEYKYTCVDNIGNWIVREHTDPITLERTITERSIQYHSSNKIDMHKCMRFIRARHSAFDNEIKSQHLLGLYYLNGYGTEKDINIGLKWLKVAAERGYLGAQYQLGLCYFEEKFGIKNLQEAMKWFSLAAEQGYEDFSDAVLNSMISFFFSDAERGDIKSKYVIGFCYYMKEDYFGALRWLREAANYEYAAAEYLIGQCYKNGRGVRKDYNEAFVYYLKASKHGNANSLYSIGDCYHYGKGVAINFVEALRHYHQAAEQGHAKAQYCLGVCYEKGIGTEIDLDEAYKWYKEAGLQGVVEGSDAAERLSAPKFGLG